MTGFARLLIGRGCHLWKLHRPPRSSKWNTWSRNIKSRPVNLIEGSGNGLTHPSSCRWSILAFLVGHARRVQVLEELIELTQVMLRLITRQFEVQTAERIRRGLLLYSVYSRLWGEEAARALLNSLRHMLVARGRQFLLSAVCISQYDWDTSKISDDCLKRAVRDIESVADLCSATVKCDKCGKRQVIDQQISNIDYCHCDGQIGYTDISRVYDSWEPFIERNHHIVWRKSHEVHKHLYAYKVYGTYDDVSLSAFMEVQLNSNFRTEWDDTALQLTVLDSHKESNSDLIYWLVKYPHFFANRDYIYKRRFTWNDEKQEAVIVNEAICPDHIAEEKGIHRVNEYWSRMVIRAKEDAHKPGLEYTLTYFDNPGTSLPQWLTNFIAVTGFPNFLQKVHEAAVSLQEVHKKGMDVYVSLPKELRYPKSELETPSVEAIPDLDVSVGGQIIPALVEESPIVCDSKELVEIPSPILEHKTNMVTDTVKVDVSGEPESSEYYEESLKENEAILRPEGIDIDKNEKELYKGSKDMIHDQHFQIEESDYCNKDEKLSEEITSEIRNLNLGEMNKFILDSLLHVNCGSKKVQVDILEAMEVVAPDLDKQTILSKNFEKLTAKALEGLEKNTVLMAKLENIRDRFKLFKKHASQKKETSMKKMHEFEKQNHYEQFDDQTQRQLEKLFIAMREVLEADKEMRTGRGYLQGPFENDRNEMFLFLSTSSVKETETSDCKRDKDEVEKEFVSSSQKKSESDKRICSKKGGESDDPPPPPSPQPATPLKGLDTTTETRSSEGIANSEIKMYNGIRNMGDDIKNDVTHTTWKRWMLIPYLMSWWDIREDLNSVDNTKEKSRVDQYCEVSEGVNVTNAQDSTSVASQVWYVIGLGWLLYRKPEVSSETAKHSEETSVLRNGSDKEENFSWYWYPVGGVYRLYSWAFKSSKENA